MSVQGIKRLHPDEDEQNSPECLFLSQPVANCELKRSPECMLPLQPASDPYSSKDSSQEDRIPKSQPKKQKVCGKRKKSSRPSTSVEIVEIIEGFHLNFLSIPKTPTVKHMEELDTKAALTSLLSFICVDSVSASDAIEAVLNLKIPQTVMKFMLHYNSYTFPQEYDGWLDDDREQHYYLQVVKEKMIGILSRIENFDTKMKSRTSVHYGTDKGFFDSFFRCVSGLIDIFPTVIELPVMTVGSDYSRSSYVCHFVSSKPDLIIGNYDDYTQPAIPVEVFNPSQYSHELSCCKLSCYENNSDPSDEASSPVTMDFSESCSSKQFPNFSEVKTFLKENFPPDFLEEVSTKDLSGFVNKLVQRLVIQLLGLSKRHIFEFTDDKHPVVRFPKRYTAIGFFTFHSYLYILKIEGTSYDIYNACTISDISWHWRHKGKYPLDVSFYPVPLDVRKPAQAVALMFFVRYYREVYRQ